MVVRLDHLGVVVVRSGKGDIVLLAELADIGNLVQSNLIAESSASPPLRFLVPKRPAR